MGILGFSLGARVVMGLYTLMQVGCSMDMLIAVFGSSGPTKSNIPCELGCTCTRSCLASTQWSTWQGDAECRELVNLYNSKTGLETFSIHRFAWKTVAAGFAGLSHRRSTSDDPTRFARSSCNTTADHSSAYPTMNEAITRNAITSDTLSTPHRLTKDVPPISNHLK